MSKINTAEVANKVRVEMAKEKLINQIKETISRDDFFIFTNYNNIIPINQKKRSKKIYEDK